MLRCMIRAMLSALYYHVVLAEGMLMVFQMQWRVAFSYSPVTPMLSLKDF